MMDERELLEVIARAARDGQTELDLSDNQLKSLPPDIGQLAAFTSLDLRFNGLESLPPKIGKLTALTSLHLGSNRLESLPPEISKLTALTSLHLSGNRLKSLPPEISKLTALTSLHLSLNGLESLPPEIGNLTALTSLHLSHNGLESLPPEIGKLTALTSLHLSGDPFNDNGLENLPPDIGNLTALTSLDLSHNGLKSLPPDIGNLTALTSLHLNDNGLESLPLDIGKLTALTSLDLNHNRLPIPPEILSKISEPDTIIAYYLQHHAPKAERRPLNEAKMLLLGQPEVGKTSLVKRLLGKGEFKLGEKQTDGIDINYWPLQVRGEQVQMNVWDFGGQEIMHATHQFFLTRRSLYLLVIDGRLGEEDSRLEYWLKLIESFGGDSPVLIVINKIDEHPLDLNERRLRAKYPSIKNFFRTSCASEEGIAELREAIHREIETLEHVFDPLLVSWFAVKEELEEMAEGKDYLDYARYRLMCEEKGLDEASQHILIGFLHDLGVVLNFQDDDNDLDTYILNPEWVTRGVYCLLTNHDLKKENGVLERRRIRDFLDGESYPGRTQRDFIVDVMHKFELCFHFDQGRKTLIPDLLPKEEPALEDWPYGDSLRFQYHYEILPSSILSRFIVRLHHLTERRRVYWRTGVVLADAHNEALVRSDPVDGRIAIFVTGRAVTRRDFLAIIRQAFKYVHGTIERLEVEAHVPIPGHDAVAVSYEHLLTLEEIGERSFVPVGMRQRVKVRPLLEGVGFGGLRRDEVLERMLQRNGAELEIIRSKLGIPGAILTDQNRATRATQMLEWAEARGRVGELESSLG